MKKTEKNEKVYDWLRKNPHKINLYRLGFRVNGRRISSGQITEVHQELDLYTGILNSSFQVDKEAVKVQTVCSGNSNRLGLRIEAGESLKKNMSLELEISLRFSGYNRFGLDFSIQTWKLSGFSWRKTVSDKSCYG